MLDQVEHARGAVLPDEEPAAVAVGVIRRDQIAGHGQALETAGRALRERLAALSLKADEKLAAVIDAVQDLRGVFQELHEATQGDDDAEISEEA